MRVVSGLVIVALLLPAMAHTQSQPPFGTLDAIPEEGELKMAIEKKKKFDKPAAPKSKRDRDDDPVVAVPPRQPRVGITR